MTKIELQKEVLFNMLKERKNYVKNGPCNGYGGLSSRLVTEHKILTTGTHEELFSGTGYEKYMTSEPSKEAIGCYLIHLDVESMMKDEEFKNIVSEMISKEKSLMEKEEEELKLLKESIKERNANILRLKEFL